MTGLIQLADNKFRDKIFERYQYKGGVYKIIALNEGEPMPVNRFLSTDTEGVLYIGKATSFVNRVTGLKKSIAPLYKGSSHICGRRYKSNPSIAVKFPYDNLFIQFIPADIPEEAERKLIREYALIFGEVPPLNAV